MRIVRFISITSLILLPWISFAAGSCSVEMNPPPSLTQYIKDTQSKINEVSRITNQCGGQKDGSFSNINRFEEVIDRVDAQNPIMPDLITDFNYNIILAVKWEARDPVIRQWQIIRQLETNIIEGLKIAWNRCALDTVMTGKYSGSTPEWLLTDALVMNKRIESYFKNVATGNSVSSNDIDVTLMREISENYSPNTTAYCKAPDMMESLKNIGSKFMDSIGRLWKGTANSQNDWQKAIALFQWTNTNTNQYKELEKKILRAELGKQWMSQNAANLMLSNLSCSQAKRSLNGTPEENGQADSDCRKDFIIGQNNIADFFKKPIFTVKNMDQYTKKVNDYQKQKKILVWDMSSYWTKLQEYKSDESALNTKTMTDLIDIHIALMQTNAWLKTRIPEMTKNCEKAQPDIPCKF